MNEKEGGREKMRGEGDTAALCVELFLLFLMWAHGSEDSWDGRPRRTEKSV